MKITKGQFDSKREFVEAYIAHMEARLKTTASAWMKSEVRKGIALAKAELAKMEVAQ